MPNAFEALQLSKGADQMGDAAYAQGAEAARAQKQRDLQTLLQAKQIKADLDKAQQEHALREQGAMNRFQQASDYASAHPNMGVSVSAEGASITPRPPNPMAEFRMQKLQDDKAEGLSKRYQPLTGFSSALQELDSKTNQNGKGGILTNPDAQLISTGSMLSAAPTQAVGLAELLGAAPKGSSDERKALERLKLEYQKAMSGMRVTDQARKQEGQAMGWMASGDPTLVAKGVRALAKNVQNTYRTIQAGYEPRVRDMVHGTMGDPIQAMGNIYDDNAPKAPAPQGPGSAISFEDFKKMKASGKIK